MSIHDTPWDLLAALADLVERHYVLEDLAPVYADRIRGGAARLLGPWPDLDATNAVLHDLVPDRHLSLRPPRPAGDDVARAEQTRPPAASGVRRVEHLGDGVCVVELHPVFGAPDVMLPHLRAAARLAAEANALVLDLRRCFGGDTDSAALVHGWLLGPLPLHLGRFEHRGRPSTDYTSDPAVGIHVSGPVRILTSADTFSGGEDIAYVQQALGRARVVGERTGGGAHPVEHFPLAGGHLCQIPVARSVIAATGSNWEGAGVTPDTLCRADDALGHARQELVATR